MNNILMTPTEKRKAYQELIQKRKNHQFANWLINPSQTSYDGEYVDPWEQWHNDLDAGVMLIGQDFCDIETFIHVKGTVEKGQPEFEYPSNKNLVEFGKEAKFHFGHPNAKRKRKGFFFTNAVAALKPGSMSANFKDKWLTESRELFLKPLLQIVDPKVIITLGSKPLQSILAMTGRKYQKMMVHLDESPIRFEGRLIFPVYHPGGLGLANRSFDKQSDDWRMIGEWISENE